MKKLTLTLAIMLCAAVAAAAPRTMALRHLDVATGLANTRINDIYSDSTGFLWFGTSSGLCRYDGYEVRMCRESEGRTASILGEYVSHICNGGAHRLWIKAGEDWHLYDTEADTVSHSLADMLAASRHGGEITTLCPDNDGSLWIAVRGDGLLRMDAGGKITVCTDSRLKETVIGTVAAATHGAVCVLGDGSLAWVGNDMKVSRMADNPSPPGVNDLTYGMYTDRNGRIWVYHNQRLSVYDTRHGIWLDDRLRHNGSGVVKTVFQDSKGTLWLARDHRGLERITERGGRFDFERAPTGGTLDERNTVVCVAEDSSGTLWAGTFKRGLYSYNETVAKFRTVPLPDVNCMLPASDGTVWVGTDNTGLWAWHPSDGSYTQLWQPGGADCAKAVTCLASDDSGRLWCGTFPSGLVCREGNSMRRVLTGTPLDSCAPMAIVQARDGRLWIGSLGAGVVAMRGDKPELTINSSNSGLPGDHVLSVIQAGDGTLCFGTSRGLALWSDSRQRLTVLHEPGQKSMTVNQVFEDSRGLLWLATTQGLKAYDRKRRLMHSVALRNGLKCLDISGIAEDAGGNIWVSEGSNIVRVTPDYDRREGLRGARAHCYDSRDGVQECEMNRRSFAMLPDGRAGVGGLHGITCFSPLAMPLNTVRPKTMFTAVEADGIPLRPGVAGGEASLSGGLNTGGSVELGHDVRMLTVFFASDNHAMPEKTRFEYRLKGFNDRWTLPAPGRHQATYTKLPPGDYTLEVRAVNNDGIEGDHVSRLPIHVAAPFWATGPAWGIYLLGVCIAMAGVWAWAGRRERRRQEAQARLDEIARLEEYIRRDEEERKLEAERQEAERLARLEEARRNSRIDPEPEAIAITPLDRKLIEKAVEAVSRNIDRPEFSVEELSAMLGMSRVSLYKKIKQTTDKTPIEFIRVIRLKRAAQLLRESQLNISEIAYQTGFNSPKVFSRYFKEEFGLLPSAYQAKEGSETKCTV